MSQLMPIFESLRQKEDLPCSYPLHMHAPSYHWVNNIFFSCFIGSVVHFCHYLYIFYLFLFTLSYRYLLSSMGKAEFPYVDTLRGVCESLDCRDCASMSFDPVLSDFFFHLWFPLHWFILGVLFWSSGVVAGSRTDYVSSSLGMLSVRAILEKKQSGSSTHKFNLIFQHFFLVSHRQYLENTFNYNYTYSDLQNLVQIKFKNQTN